MTCKNKAFFSIFFLCLYSLLSPPLSFTATSTITLQIKQLHLTKLPQIQCYFSVFDENGKHIVGLTSSDFNIFEDKNFISNFEIASLSEKEDALAVVLVLDKSGSMKSSYLDKSKSAATEFIRKLGRFDEGAVISFDTKVKLESDFTQDKIKLSKIIQKITAGSDTALNDAIYQGLELIKKNSLARKAVVVLTDGKENKSNSADSQILQLSASEGIPIYTIGLGKSVSKDMLNAIAAKSGGKYFFAPQAEDLLSLYRQIAEELKNQYVLTYNSLSGEDNKWHTIKIVANIEGGSYGVKKSYLATTGTGVNINAISKFEVSETKKLILRGVGIGALCGVILSIVIIIILKLMRKDLFRFLILKVVIISLILGSAAGVLVISILRITTSN